MNKNSEQEEFSELKINQEANDFLKNILFVILGLLISYFFLKSHHTTSNSLTKFDELLNIINKNYVDTIAINSIEDKAVSNLLSNLDPHSVYISKEELQAANEPLEGNFSGVGIEFFIANDTLVVVSPINGGPSDIAGIKSGDKIIFINDTIVAGVKLKNIDVVTKLRGLIDTKVKLGIKRGSDSKIINFIINRNNIKVNSVEPVLAMENHIGYIKINTFGENTYREFYDALNSLIKNNQTDKLIIDLRQNTGGYLEIAVQILDELISDKQLLVYTQGRNYPKEQYFSEKKGLFETGKIAILLDEGSASASEIVAGAIQDLDRGIVVGRRSFGKGLVQNQISLRDGSAVRLTIAKYYTPSGRNIQKPYKSNKNYETEIYDRYNDGEMFDESKQKVVDTVKYYTSKGRIVKAGGGIYPDYFVSIDTNYDFNNYSKLRGIVPDFIYSNHSLLSKEISKYKNLDDFISNYKIDSKFMTLFYNNARKQKITWNTNRIQSFEGKLKMNLKAYIAKQFYSSEGFYKILNETDLSILKAKNILLKEKN